MAETKFSHMLDDFIHHGRGNGDPWQYDDLSGKTGLSERSLKDWASGARRPPNETNFKVLCGVFFRNKADDEDRKEFIQAWKDARDSWRSVGLPDAFIVGSRPVAKMISTASKEVTEKAFETYFVHPATDDKEFGGRHRALAELDSYAYDPIVRIVHIHAMGGAGKTALAGHWLRNRERGGGLSCRQFEASFFWSFYENSDQVAALSELADHLESKLGKSRPKTTVNLTDWLLETCERHCVCVCFDGVEVIQERGFSNETGGFIAGSVRQFVYGLLVDGLSLLILTSRFSASDIAWDHDPHFRDLPLERFDEDDGIKLLRRLGVPGHDQQIGEYARALEGHALGLRVLALCFKDNSRRQINTKDVVHNVIKHAISGSGRLEQRLIKLIDYYSTQLDEEDREIMSWVAIYRQSISVGTISKLMKIDITAVASRIRRLVDDGILQKETRSGFLSAHPLVRARCRPRDKARVDDAIKLIHDRPVEFRPSNLEEARPTVEAIQLYADSSEFNKAADLLKQHLDFGNLLIDYDGEIELRNCLLAFFQETNTEESLKTDFSDDILSSRATSCVDALKSEDAKTLLRQLHFLMANLGQWDDAHRFCQMERTLFGNIQVNEAANQDDDVILFSNALIESAIGDIDVAVECYKVIVAHQNARSEAPMALLKIADLLGQFGHRREAINYVEQWMRTGPKCTELTEWLSGWTEACGIVANALRRTNVDGSRHFRLAMGNSIPENVSIPVNWNQQIGFYLAHLAQDWEEVLVLATQFEGHLDRRGNREGAAKWICGQAEALTRSDKAASALALLKRAEGMTHPNSWARLWIKLEQLRAKVEIVPSNKHTLLLNEAWQFARKAHGRRQYLLLYEASEIIRRMAELLNLDDEIIRADGFREEAIAARNLETGWAPDLGVLPGEPRWQDRVVGWAIEIQRNRRKFADADAAAAACQAAIFGNMPGIAKAILTAHLNIIKVSELLPLLLCTMAVWGEAEALRVLYESGIDPTIRSKDGTTPLHAAALNGHAAIVIDLLSRVRSSENGRAFIEAKGDGGATALHVAVQQGHVDIVDALLSAGADVLSKTNSGSTALILAARGSDIEIVKLLLTRGVR